MKKCKTTGNPPGLRDLLFTRGFGWTLEYLCTYAVFSVD